MLFLNTIFELTKLESEWVLYWIFSLYNNSNCELNCGSNDGCNPVSLYAIGRISNFELNCNQYDHYEFNLDIETNEITNPTNIEDTYLGGAPSINLSPTFSPSNSPTNLPTVSQETCDDRFYD